MLIFYWLTGDGEEGDDDEHNHSRDKMMVSISVWAIVPPVIKCISKFSVTRQSQAQPPMD